MECLKLVALGCTNTEIARILTITKNTAKVHVSDIIKKLSAKDRTNAVYIACKIGILT